MEIIESKEKRQSENDAVHQLRAEMGLLKEETSAAIAQLGETVRKLTQENESLREELRKMSDTNLLSTREQQNNPPLNQTTDTGSQTETSNQAETKNNRTDPSPLPPHTSLPPTQPTKEQRIEPLPLPPQPSEEQSTPSCQEAPKTAILMDSNGKFLHHRKLFPRHRVGMFWCPHTDSALKMLCHAHLGQPDNIIIHTGTNDLRYKREGISEALTEVAKKACKEFPKAKITISFRLPRSDFPRDVINGINNRFATACGTLTNVAIDHHPTITTEHLYDRVHLDRSNIWRLAEDLRVATPCGGDDPALRPHRAPHQPGGRKAKHDRYPNSGSQPSGPPRTSEPTRPPPSGSQPYRPPPRGTQPSGEQPRSGFRPLCSMPGSAPYTGTQHSTTPASP